MKFRYTDDYGHDQTADILAVCQYNDQDYVIIPRWEYDGSGGTHKVPGAVRAETGEIYLGD